MAAQSISEGSGRSKENNALGMQEEQRQLKRTQKELFVWERSGARRVRKHRDDGCRYKISKI